MKSKREVSMSFINDSTKIKDVELHYKNGIVINGFVHKTNGDYCILCLHQTPKGADPNHQVDYDNIEFINITFHDNNVLRFD